MAVYRSQLLELLYSNSLANRVLSADIGDSGIADTARFPFLAIVGQFEMKLALLLSLVNRQVGGVLLIGPRGTGKTTAIRGLIDLVPTRKINLCPYGCEEEAAFSLGIDAVCEECAQKIARGESLTTLAPMRLIELPLNARLDDVVGGINERVAVEQHKIQLNRGILSHADQNLLYIDEVNLLDDDIVNAILDAAAQGHFTVRRGPMAATYRSRLYLIGSMNPEEGRLRPQMQDRFGLRVIVRGIQDPEARLDVYRRSVAYQQQPHAMIAEWQFDTLQAQEDIQAATGMLGQVKLAPDVEQVGLSWIRALEIESHRAEISLFEAARAYAALAGRTEASLEDMRLVAPMALRQRQSEFINQYMETQDQEDARITDIINT